MNVQQKKLTLPALAVFLVIFVVLFGVSQRFYRITANDFFFYDEGYYLNESRLLLKFVENHGGGSLENFWNACRAVLKASLATNKALWFLIVNLRVVFFGAEAWFFPRIVSAVFGSLTLIPLFLFSRRFFRSDAVAWISVGLLAILPSHVFYSHLGMQEALSTFLFLWGFYFYLFPGRFYARPILSAAFLAAAFFTNYRLIVLPLLVAFIELFVSATEHRRPALRKYVWHTVTFFAIVFLVGTLDGAKNIAITFGWMFRQVHLASGEAFDWFNFLTYPYDLFLLEHPFLGVLFFGNLYFAWRRQWTRLFPFCLVTVYMIMFSVTGEKAARFLCVMTPFIAMSVAILVVELWQKNRRDLQGVLCALLVVMLCGMMARSRAIAVFRADYHPAMAYLDRTAQQSPVVTTQPLVLNLYRSDPETVAACPTEYRELFQMYTHGFRYLVVDPQAYISWTENGRRFDLPLKGFLSFIVRQVEPVKTFPHFEKMMLERFVLDHNESLRTSLKFLRSGPAKAGQLRIYDLDQCFFLIRRALQMQEQKRKSL